MREVLDNDTTSRYIISLSGLGVSNMESISLSMTMKTGMEVGEDYIVLNYRTPRPQKFVNSEYRAILEEPYVKPSPSINYTK